ncbi:DNA-directed RNA polymerase, RBP11-like dimerization domain containing protein [Nitzschia inconspicua]|uniref:DNA-directed RNA polymerase, RBP11-like dimerization domain containing protein n=1 Tax=Nitzschia inconspicua TaxID=303405 RepID=A0A9K3M6R9_9STRA|nr:DNA-directed RNA polymerase, RBP11-like dimerization domain containing protein [Nitzschia inconspicua]KAG7375078.1 DNA-directed RNA polymerase, RBP11-like dimerization domain containing protein [Nitzschia inconspicua]
MIQSDKIFYPLLEPLSIDVFGNQVIMLDSGPFNDTVAALGLRLALNKLEKSRIPRVFHCSMGPYVCNNVSMAVPLWDKATFTEDLEQFQQSLKRRPEDDDLDDDIVTVKPSDEKFVFSVEATGAMFAYEIVMSALKDKLLYLQQEVENGCCICNKKSKI